MDGVLVRKGLLNGLGAWCIGFALYVVPAFVVAFGLSFELGRQGRDAAAISSQISQRIPTMYAGNRLLTVGLIAMTALAVLWRARRLAGGAKAGAVVNGLIVGAVAAALTVLMFLGFGSFAWPSILAIVADVAAGAVGGVFGRGASTPGPEPRTIGETD
jgi:hypothetical protein